MKIFNLIFYVIIIYLIVDLFLEKPKIKEIKQIVVPTVESTIVPKVVPTIVPTVEVPPIVETKTIIKMVPEEYQYNVIDDTNLVQTVNIPSYYGVIQPQYRHIYYNNMRHGRNNTRKYHNNIKKVQTNPKK